MTTEGLLRPIELLCPSRIDFGAGTVGTVGQWAAGRGLSRILVVADAFNAGRVKELGLAGDVTVFSDVLPEPDVGNLNDALALAAAARPEMVVGFGGGSAMDLAKLVAVLAGSKQSIAEVVGAERVAGRQAALAQVPTTAGTGSEAGTRALVTDPVSRNKLAVQSRHLLADLAVVDPDLTISVPPQVTAATGVDALAHCVEAYTNRRAHPIIDGYALAGIRLVGRFLARAVTDGTDHQARAGLSLAALYGGLCLGPVNTAAGHAVAYPLGTRHHVAHGAANALIFPHVLAFNQPAAAARTAAVLEAMGLAATDDPASVFAQAFTFCRRLGIEMRLSALGVPEGDLGAMADEAAAIRRLLDNNPREMSRDDIFAIYRNAF